MRTLAGLQGRWGGLLVNIVFRFCFYKNNKRTIIKYLCRQPPRTLAGLAALQSLSQIILLTPIAVPVQWRC